MEKRPPSKEVLHSFMLWYQEKYECAASLKTMLKYCPLWATRQGAHNAVKTLEKRSLVESRPPKGPGNAPRNQWQWWALDVCSNCLKLPVMKNQESGWHVSLCQQCFDTGLGRQNE